MLSTYTDVTKTQARALARRAREYGYFRGEPGNATAPAAWVNCPECRDKVTGWSSYPHRTSDLMRGLDAAMVDHLTMGDCSAHPDRSVVQ